MKKRIIALLLCLLTAVSVFCLVPGTASASAAPDITSGNALVAYCVDNGQLLYGTRTDESVAPTVAAKLVTAMVVYDLFGDRGLSLEDTAITVTAESLLTIGSVGDVSAPMMGFSAGNTYFARDLLSATLVANANDACSALAYYCGETFLGGGIADFIARMNKKVQSLGLQRTKFVNATGLDSVSQVTTPGDVAQIAAAFYKYDYLVKLSDVESFLFNGKTTVRNKNYLLSNFFVSGFLNKSAIGMIAGQKDSKGDYCLITAVEKDGRAYVFVVMCATGMLVDASGKRSFGEGNAYADMNKLITWTDTSFGYITVASTTDVIDEIRVNLGSSADYVIIVPSETVERLVNTDASAATLEKTVVYDESIVYKSEFGNSVVNTIDAPVTRGQRVGSVTYSYNGLEIVTVDLVAKDSIDSSGMLTLLSKIKGFLFGSVMMTILKILAAILILYVLFSIVTAIIRGIKRIRGKNGEPKKPRRPKGKKKPPTDEKTVTREAQ